MSDSMPEHEDDFDTAEMVDTSINSQRSGDAQLTRKASDQAGDEDDPPIDIDSPSQLPAEEEAPIDEGIASHRKRPPPSAEEASSMSSSFLRRKKKAKKPDSGYSIFFRHERARLLESGDAIEDIFEKEVAPISTLETANQTNKALVKVIAKRWNNLNLSSRLRYETLAQQQKKKMEKRAQDTGIVQNRDEEVLTGRPSAVADADGKPRATETTTQPQSAPLSSSAGGSAPAATTQSSSFGASGMTSSSSTVEAVIQNVLALLGFNIPLSQSGTSSTASPSDSINPALLGSLFQAHTSVLQIAIDTLKIVLGLKQALENTTRQQSGPNTLVGQSGGVLPRADFARAILDLFSGPLQAQPSMSANSLSTSNVGFSGPIPRPAAVGLQTAQNPLASPLASHTLQSRPQPSSIHPSSSSTSAFPQVAAPPPAAPHQFSTAATNHPSVSEANEMSISQSIQLNGTSSSTRHQQSAVGLQGQSQGQSGGGEQDLLAAVLRQLLSHQQQQNQTRSEGKSDGSRH